MNDILTKYTDPKHPGSFSGLQGFKKNNPHLKGISKILFKNETYTLHKPTIKKFKRRKTFVPNIDDTWQVDLVDVVNLKNKKYSQFYSFILTCIDVFSKYAWAIPIKTKSANETADAINNIFLNSKRKPRRVYSDRGKEFLGAFAQTLKKNDIQQMFTKSKFKAAVVERFNRTLKEKMFRYFTFSKEKNYRKFYITRIIY